MLIGLSISGFSATQGGGFTLDISRPHSPETAITSTGFIPAPPPAILIEDSSGEIPWPRPAIQMCMLNSAWTCLSLGSLEKHMCPSCPKTYN